MNDTRLEQEIYLLQAKVDRLEAVVAMLLGHPVLEREALIELANERVVRPTLMNLSIQKRIELAHEGRLWR